MNLEYRTQKKFGKDPATMGGGYNPFTQFEVSFGDAVEVTTDIFDAHT